MDKLKGLGPLWICLIFGLLFSSCEESDEITPLFEAETINDQRNHEPIKLNYSIDEVQVNRFGEDIAEIPLVGRIFRRIGESVADVVVNQSGGKKVETPPTVLSFPELSQIDFNIIDYIKLSDVLIRAHSSSSKEEASLNFIRELNVYIRAGEFLDVERYLNPQGSEEGLLSEVKDLFSDYSKTRVLKYHRGSKKVSCEKACLLLEVEKNEWKETLTHNQVFLVEVEIIVDSVPRSTLKIDGEIGLNIGFDLGF